MSYNLIEVFSNKYFISSRRDYLERELAQLYDYFETKLKQLVQKPRTYFDV